MSDIPERLCRECDSGVRWEFAVPSYRILRHQSQVVSRIRFRNVVLSACDNVNCPLVNRMVFISIEIM
jgi:hypothetical protein